MIKSTLFIILVSSFVILSSCYKEEFETSSSVSIDFSTDTVAFDTIFTKIGSVTKRFKVYNSYNKTLKISSIIVAGGKDSPFKLNINGLPGIEFKDIKILPKDSLYVFAEVTIDPVNSNLPMLVNDSIIFTTNGNESDVKLVAFGQDVHFLRDKMIKTQTWRNDKPYLIYDYVGLDSNEVLTIEKGTRIHLHDKAGLVILGTLKIEGTHDEPVVFTSDRKDRGYAVSAGQWEGIILNPPSKNNVINYAVLKNSIRGLQVGVPDDEPQAMVDVELRNTIIQNSSFCGILGFYPDITAYNTVITDCGTSAIIAFQGGKYNMYHCTISNIGSYSSFYGENIYYNGAHSAPSVMLWNYYDYFPTVDELLNLSFVPSVSNLEEANFFNCIITGTR
ncbi:MAG: hypothetical protein MI922_21080, partial [Bacteroidales bacterium]|nr:hypothetical protein [Bacteroidales bacterium]